MFSFLKKDKGQEVLIDVSSRTIIRVLVWIAITVGLYKAVLQARHALILIFVAFFLALALNAPVHWLGNHLPGKRKGNRTLATAVSFLIIIVFISFFVASIVPPLIRQTQTFIHAVPNLISEVHNQNTSLGNFVRTYHLENQVSNFSSQLDNRLSSISGSAFSTITSITNSVFSILSIFVLTFMMLAEGPSWLNFFKKLIPDNRQKHVDRLAQDMYRVIRGYVNGQVLLAAIASIIIFIPLVALHISYPVALLVVVFFAALIPLIGHTIGAIIVTGVALFHSPVDAFIILTYYVIYMQIEAYIIQPRIQSNTTNMSALLVFASVIIGVSFDGLLGGLVAIPVAGCIRVMLYDYLQSHNLISEVDNETSST